MNLVLFDRRRSLGSVVKEMLKGRTLKPGDVFELNHWTHRGEDDRRKDAWNEEINCIGVPTSKLDDFLALPIEKLELHQTRWYNALHEGQVHFVGQLIRMWGIHIREIKGIGKHGAQRIFYALRPFGIYLMDLPCGKKELKKLKLIPISWILRIAQISEACRDQRKIPKEPPKLTELELKNSGIHTIGDMLSSNRQFLKRCFRKARAKGYFRLVNSRKYRQYDRWTTKDCIEEAKNKNELFRALECFLLQFDIRIPDVTPRPIDPYELL